MTEAHFVCGNPGTYFLSIRCHSHRISNCFSFHPMGNFIVWLLSINILCEFQNDIGNDILLGCCFPVVVCFIHFSLLLYKLGCSLTTHPGTQFSGLQIWHYIGQCMINRDFFHYYLQSVILKYQELTKGFNKVMRKCCTSNVWHHIESKYR